MDPLVLALMRPPKGFQWEASGTRPTSEALGSSVNAAKRTHTACTVGHVSAANHEGAHFLEEMILTCFVRRIK